jgi:hypothetical protein
MQNMACGRDNPCTDERLLIFPGGGIYFWWQAGVVKALQQQNRSDKNNLDTKNLALSGASAGSISCVMAICKIDMDHAMKAALVLADEAGIFNRTEGLAGIWGGLIERWLQELLPDDCHEKCSGRVNISVVSLSVSFVPLHRHVISTFKSKKDLIEACLTSVHIPYFIDGKFSHEYQGVNCLDGSVLFVLHNAVWCKCEEFGETSDSFIFNHRNDKKLMQCQWGFLQTINKDNLAKMFSLGHEYGMRWVKKQRKNLEPTRLPCVWNPDDKNEKHV